MGDGSPQHDDAPETGADSRVPNDAPETGRTYGESVDAAAAAAASGSGSASSSAAASGSAAAASVRPERPAFGEYATPEEQRAAIRVPFDTEEGVPVVADADAPVAPVDHDGHAASSPASYGERVAGAQRPTPQPTGQDAPSTSGSSKPSRASARGESGAPSGNGSGSGTGNGSGTGTRSGSGSANGKQTPAGFFANAFGGGSSAATTADGPADGVAPARRDRLVTYLLLAFGLLVVLNTVSGIAALPASVRRVFEQWNIEGTPPVDLFVTLGWITTVVVVVMWVVALLWSLRAMRRGKLSWWIPVLCGVIVFVIAVVVFSVGSATDPTIMNSFMQRG
ncbi:hypothetical protein SAMN06309945_1080 [Okibacterium fritillariae]|uniref:Uncharacterized protein n=2 Tax=Okibacterium fritillariae TaxID=123320 RepID=A0A1T5J0B4_9MICO|nr:hypothetical protein SAMN06309945_1080 [Okibacterium fritillariae]